MAKFYSVNADLSIGLALLLCGRAAEKGRYGKVFFHLEKASSVIPQGPRKLKPFPLFQDTCLITGQVVCMCCCHHQRWYLDSEQMRILFSGSKISYAKDGFSHYWTFFPNFSAKLCCGDHECCEIKCTECCRTDAEYCDKKHLLLRGRSYP